MIALPYRFPSQADQIAEEAAAFQALSPNERLQALLDHIAASEVLLATSPHREAILRQGAEREAEWQRIQKEIIAR